ncbi:hypothetical protein ZYGR_0AD03870 [Zygosaccharomyces rouxii]|uniref:tRNA ligase n=2 Tax=Zygosaccharomyces rouxii TaxID=4956 RepID=C5E0R9_ZYGRC|nr:uncharacterized protein ZYRO0G15070g [Zygosaccharomyces rouxii]KAH9202697.1 RNA ligase-domain-containing protein [Zygosaccharomyces rouxii]GAV51204.1 hypothetical protein ZYGR_0AD03870 [Zygosaccharomyces rouxii]CAR29703.1 ZYRO0G15070p [Zygosaccharomyces rouxii]
MNIENSKEMNLQRPSVKEVKNLVASLERSSELSGRGKSSKRVCQLFNSDRRVVSWKFQEWDYGKKNITLPCNARGLFITDDKENPQIVTRGYDKFFNIDEMSLTKWDSIAKGTVGPYTITLKSNGCIIFISGLEDGTLVVCSKHSTGPRDDVDRNHAEFGRNYLLNLLRERNVDVKQFARRLYDLNVTLVAEYCDDSFEEHILEYTGDSAGLYLHGVNLNKPEFVTWPMKEVNGFAQEYGFKPTMYFDLPDITSLKSFLDKCSHDGTYKGMEVEGFVIRTHLTETGQDFFFKFKFEEPYLMYRQWREVTKQYISSKSRLLKYKRHKFITNNYLDFVIPILDNDPKLSEQYMKGFGIIKLRNMFLKSYGMSGLEILNQEKIQELELKNATNDSDIVDEKTKFLIFPISVIGCGKTTTALTLTNLFPNWGHIQNDDITGKDKSMLIKKSLELLAKPDIKCVFVDRNNHQRREREQLFTWVEQLRENYLPYYTNIKTIGLSFASYDDLEKVKKLTIDRVLARGDNHQSIKSSVYGEQKVLGIMNGFVKRYQPINENRDPDNLFDYVIHLNSLDTNSSLINAKETAKKLHEKYPVLVPNIPTDEQIEKALERSLEYKPTTKKVVGGGGNRNKDKNRGKKSDKSKRISPVYFSANIEKKENIIEIVKKTFEGLNSERKSSLSKLIEEDRFQPKFHITLCHVTQGKNGAPETKQLWASYLNRYNSELEKLEDLPQILATGDKIKFKPIKLCWDEKIVSMVVQLSAVLDPHNHIVSELSCGNAIPHITVGILQDGVKPFYSNELCQKIFSNNPPPGSQCIDLDSQDIEAGICINF